MFRILIPCYEHGVVFSSVSLDIELNDIDSQANTTDTLPDFQILVTHITETIQAAAAAHSHTNSHQLQSYAFCMHQYVAESLLTLSSINWQYSTCIM